MYSLYRLKTSYKIREGPEDQNLDFASIFMLLAPPSPSITGTPEALPMLLLCSPYALLWMVTYAAEGPSTVARI